MPVHDGSSDPTSVNNGVTNSSVYGDYGDVISTQYVPGVSRVQSAFQEGPARSWWHLGCSGTMMAVVVVRGPVRGTVPHSNTSVACATKLLRDYTFNNLKLNILVQIRIA